jgi:hypothetical protein
MGKAERTTKLLLDLGDPQAGGANVGKREYLASTTRILNDARAFYLEFFLSVIKDCIGKARAYSTAHASWKESGKKRSKPGKPTPTNHPTLYTGVFSLQLDQVDLHQSFVKLRVSTGTQWVWANYPVQENRYFEARMNEQEWTGFLPSWLCAARGWRSIFRRKRPLWRKRLWSPNVIPIWSRWRSI